MQGKQTFSPLCYRFCPQPRSCLHLSAFDHRLMGHLFHFPTSPESGTWAPPLGISSWRAGYASVHTPSCLLGFWGSGAVPGPLATLCLGPWAAETAPSGPMNKICQGKQWAGFSPGVGERWQGGVLGTSQEVPGGWWGHWCCSGHSLGVGVGQSVLRTSSK